MVVSLFANSQTIDSLKTLKELQVIGLNPIASEPVTLSIIKCDSLKDLNQGYDPFFMISKLSSNTLAQSDNGTGMGYSYMRIRGLDQTRINFTLNGIPLNEMEDQGIYFSNMPGFYSNINNIQVQRGIGTSKYGTTSIAGSINMESKSPLKKETIVEVGLGDFDTKRLSVNYASGLIKNSKIAVYSQFGESTTEGFKNHSESRGFNYFGEIGYFGDKNTIKLYGFLGASRNQLAFNPVSKTDINTFGYRYNSNSLRDTDRFSQNFIVLNWINYQKKNIKFNTSIYTNGVNGKYNIGIDTINYTFKVDGRQTGALTNFIYEKNNLIVNTGLNYNYYQRSHFGPTDSSNYKNTGYKQDYIAYSKIIYPINKIRLFADIQIRRVDFLYNGSFKKNFNWLFFNPKFGAKYLGNHFDNYISLGKTSREPGRSDIFYGNDNPNKSDTIINLSPEHVYDLEIGTTYHNQNLILSGNIYLMKFYNEYVATGNIDVYSGLMKKKVFTNSLRTGIELDGSYTIKKFMFLINTSISKNKVYTDYLANQTYIFKEQTTPYGSPDFLMNNIIQYGKMFKISLNGSYVSKIYLNNTQSDRLSTPKYYIVGGAASLNLDDDISLVLNVNNIFNQKYYLPGGVISDDPAYYVGSLRSLFITLKIKI